MILEEVRMWRCCLALRSRRDHAVWLSTLTLAIASAATGPEMPRRTPCLSATAWTSIIAARGTRPPGRKPLLSSPRAPAVDIPGRMLISSSSSATDASLGPEEIAAEEEGDEGEGGAVSAVEAARGRVREGRRLPGVPDGALAMDR